MRSTGRSRPLSNEGGSRLPSFAFRAVRYSRGRLRILDQRALPGRVRYLAARSAGDVVRAIKTLAVRGAPSIGVAAAYGLAVEARRLGSGRLRSGLERAARRLARARPTAVNLSRAVERVGRLWADPGIPGSRLTARIEAEARAVEAEEVARSLAIARRGARLLPRDATVLTICNTGALAGPGFGTALGIVFQCHLAGRRPRVYACETRPLLQGARLTTLELLRAGVPVTLIVDSAAASVMPEVDVVLVGADRVARNGDFANKVGTKTLALLAREYRRPFYVAAPGTTFDRHCARGGDIVVEERTADEVRRVGRCRTAPAGVPVRNPAFDVTPGSFVAGFVTEAGVLRPPYSRSLRRLA